MSSDPIPVNVEILDKEYMISCLPHEKEALLESAKILNERLQQARDSGKVMGTERMAVMTALNIIHEYSQLERAQPQTSAELDENIKRLQSKIRTAIGRRRPVEAVD